MLPIFLFEGFLEKGFIFFISGPQVGWGHLHIKVTGAPTDPYVKGLSVTDFLQKRVSFGVEKQNVGHFLPKRGQFSKKRAFFSK
jgi:DNA repair exonuclease SbcCD nuclease subunit